MYQVHAEMTRQDAERLSEILASLEPSPVQAVSTEEVSRVAWSLDAFCLDETEAEGAAEIIEREVPGVRASVLKLDDRDWVAESLSGLPPVHAGPFVVTGAHNLAGVRGGRIPIWIEAGPAFGTGHHGTTKGCLLALSALLPRQRPTSVLDVGCGSGVLAIAALKAGARTAVASDLDADSVRIAHENAVNNQVRARMNILHAVGVNDRAIRSFAPYDLVFANILARPLVGLAPGVTKLIRPGGRIILSGLLTHQEPQVRAAYAGQGMILERRGRLNGWSTLTYVRPLAGDAEGVEAPETAEDE
jgi:ribosomal protein L11 methyltransferase